MRILVPRMRRLCKEGRLKEAVDILYVISNSKETYAFLLRGCSNLKASGLVEGKRVHGHMIKTGFEPDVYIWNDLVHMYCKCVSLIDARQVFDKMPVRNTVSWNTIISGYSQHGYSEKSVELFCQMQRASCVEADQFTFGSVVRACGSLAALETGRQIHGHTIKSCKELNVFVGSALVDMYAKCGNMEDARNVFDKIRQQDVVLLTGMITGYVQNGCPAEALKIFCQMRKVRINPNQITYASILRACGDLAALEEGKQLHAHTIKIGFEFHVSVGTALVSLYAKCESIVDAHRLFDRMPERDVVSWNAMIVGYAQQGDGKEVLQLYEQKQQSGMGMNDITYTNIVRACASPETLKPGKYTHGQIIKTGFKSDVFVGSALVDLYANCGNIEDAHQVFNKMPKRDNVLWNAIIAGYAESGHGEEALKMFSQRQRATIELDQETFACVLSACAKPEFLEQGRQVHSHIVKTGSESNICVANALVSMYAKCTGINNAHLVFDEMPEKDVVSWTAILAEYTPVGHSEAALKLFCQMQRTGMDPDYITFASVLRACGGLAALEQGETVHAHIIKAQFESDVSVRNALVSMYAKCGSIQNAHKVFAKMHTSDVVSWNAMIAGYAQHGLGMEALKLFEQMQQVNMKPDHITFIGVISACSHVGLVDKGWHYFDSMSLDYGITPRAEHYACMVDLLGRAGQLHEAEVVIDKMPFKPGAVVWRTLLSACRVHGNMELGKRAAECLLELEPQDDSTYVLLSNIYATAGQWDEVAKVRKLMKERGVKKEPGCSWIEIKSKVHAFVAGDRSHPQTVDIYTKLEELTAKMKETGYVPDVNFVV